MTKRLRPFFSFYGSKFRLAAKYPAPKYDTIIEPFAGSAQYATLYPHKKVRLIEKDPVIVAVWRYLICVPQNELMRLPMLLPGQTIDELDICQEAKYLIGFWCNRASAQPHNAPSRWMLNPHTRGNCWDEVSRERISSQLPYIRHWTIDEGDYFEADNQHRATWFIDPPYQTTGRHYRFSEIDYNHLSAFCQSRYGQTIVCELSNATWLPFQPLSNITVARGRYGTKVNREGVWVNEN